jgi:hypothetical protein
MSQPVNKQLYDTVKQEASKVFDSPTGAYRSAWIVREYKKRGGTYTGARDKESGLTRWFNEDWVDLNRPLGGGTYAPCGRKDASKGMYPLCRPINRLKGTPKTVSQLTKKEIDLAKKLKVKVEGRGKVSF